MKIKVIVPIANDVFNEEVKREFKTFAGEGVEFDVENLDYGPASIESRFDESFAIPDIIFKVQKAADDGFNGAIVDCFGDPGVGAAREAVEIPVCGAFEPSILMAAGLGQHLGVVTVLPNVIPMLQDMIERMGMAKRLVSVRSVDIPVLELGDRSKLENALYEESVKAIKENGVHVIILGCTGMIGLANALSDKLKAAGYDLPVIDPAFAAMKQVESYVAMGVKPSRLTFMTPPDKPRKWWGQE